MEDEEDEDEEDEQGTRDKFRSEKQSTAAAAKGGGVRFVGKFGAAHFYLTAHFFKILLKFN